MVSKPGNHLTIQAYTRIEELIVTLQSSAGAGDLGRGVVFREPSPGLGRTPVRRGRSTARPASALINILPRRG